MAWAVAAGLMERLENGARQTGQWSWMDASFVMQTAQKRWPQGREEASSRRSRQTGHPSSPSISAIQLPL